MKNIVEKIAEEMNPHLTREFINNGQSLMPCENSVEVEHVYSHEDLKQLRRAQNIVQRTVSRDVYQSLSRLIDNAHDDCEVARALTFIYGLKNMFQFTLELATRIAEQEKLDTSTLPATYPMPDFPVLGEPLEEKEFYVLRIFFNGVQTFRWSPDHGACLRTVGGPMQSSFKVVDLRPIDRLGQYQNRVTGYSPRWVLQSIADSKAALECIETFYKVVDSYITIPERNLEVMSFNDKPVKPQFI